MPRRLPSRSTTEETRQSALDAVLALLEEDLESVTVVGVADKLSVGVHWVYTYVGNRDEMLRTTVLREVSRLCQRLDEVTHTEMTPQKRVRTVLQILIPKRQHRAALWALTLATGYGWGQRGILAQAISRALGPGMGPYRVGIGGGILGVLGEAVGGAWFPTREELLKVITDMTMAVALFQEAVARRDKK